MHVLGKVLTWLTVALAIGAILLTVKLFQVRNSWAREVETRQQDIAKAAENLKVKQAELQQVQQQYATQMSVWGKYWFPATANVAQDGTVTLNNVGRDHGLGRPPAGRSADATASPEPTYFLFSVQQDGSSKFAGSFTATQVAANTATLTPAFIVRPQEPQQWQGASWRVRSAIPPKYRRRFDDLLNQIVTAATKLGDQQRALTLAETNAQEAAEIVANREAELQGDPAQPSAVGLVARVEDADAARNEELAELARLRREVQQIYQQRENLRQQLTKNN